MNDLTVFNNEQFGEVRTVTINNEPWFVAADVCKALSLGTTAKALGRLEDDEKGMNSIHTPGGEQEMTIINEYGLYSLVLGSRKPEAKAFKRWITHDVIPSIRKTGAYATPEMIKKIMSDPGTMMKLLANYSEAKDKAEKLEIQIEHERPLKEFALYVTGSEDCILVRDMAKIVTQSGIRMGQTKLFEWLYANNILIKGGTSHNMPTQSAANTKVIFVKETTIHAEGKIKLQRTPMITGFGQVYILNRIHDTMKGG